MWPTHKQGERGNQMLLTQKRLDFIMSKTKQKSGRYYEY